MQNINNKLHFTVTTEKNEEYTLKEIKARIDMLKEQKDVINAQLDYWQDLKQQALNLGVAEPVEEELQVEAIVEPTIDEVI